MGAQHFAQPDGYTFGISSMSALAIFDRK